MLGGIRGPQLLSIGLTSFYDDVVRMMGQTVQCRIGHDRIREQGDPVLRGPVAVDDHRGCEMSLGDDLIEILGLSSSERSKTKIIDD